MRDLSAVTTNPATLEDARITSASRSEALRRANLYGVSSANRLPQVQVVTAPTRDARVRKDLQLLADRGPSSLLDQHHHVYEDECNDRKHREDLGLRPPLDAIQRLQDLFTTVAKDLRTQHASNQQHGELGHTASGKVHSSSTKREWRVGYKNNPHGGSRGPLNGMFEPSDAVRECALVITRDPLALQQSLAIAYPVAAMSPEKIACEMQPFDEEAAWDAMERRTSVHRGRVNQEDEDEDEGTPWCPASYLTIQTKGSESSLNKKSLKPGSGPIQTHALRRVATYSQEKGAARARKAPLAVDDSCVKKKQNLLSKAAASYARIREQLDRSKDPKLRYALPVEDLTKKRAYRLGLEPVPSTFEAADQTSNNLESEAPTGAETVPTERLRFRPRSAAGNVPFRSSALRKSLSSSGSFSALEPALSVGKVAGAKRRPHSASVCYLKSSTVYCVDAPNSQPASYNRQQQSSLHDQSQQQQQDDGADFGSVLDRERRKRRCNQDQTLAMLSKRGLFHNLTVPQIFARLRRESLKNLTKRLQHAQFEKMALEEYMSSCGMQTIVGEPVETGGPEPLSLSGITSNKVIKVSFAAIAAVVNSVEIRSATTSSSLLAMRKLLFVTRQQFHIALEAFNLTPSDVNLLFSALDTDVEDRVALWEVLCAVEKLQDGHAQLRRSRVQIKARDLPKDLDLLRNSFRIPNVTHAPLEVGQQARTGAEDS